MIIQTRFYEYTKKAPFSSKNVMEYSFVNTTVKKIYDTKLQTTLPSDDKDLLDITAVAVLTLLMLVLLFYITISSFTHDKKFSIANPGKPHCTNNNMKVRFFIKLRKKHVFFNHYTLITHIYRACKSC